MSHADIVARILANPLACQVNRAEKMDKTIAVMVSNANKIIAKNEGGSISVNNNRGYGEGRKMGD
jgi:hypothetical protein